MAGQNATTTGDDLVPRRHRRSRVGYPGCGRLWQRHVRLETGDRVWVDGGRGTVEILETAS